MARLPTVKLRHRKTGKRSIINASLYQRDIGRYKDYEIISVRHGDATDAQVLLDAAERNENDRRLNDPAEARKRGDKDRAMSAAKVDLSRSGITGVVSAPTEPQVEASASDWKKMKWFRMRQFVKDATGTLPKDRDHAERLMVYKADSAGKTETIGE